LLYDSATWKLLFLLPPPLFQFLPLPPPPSFRFLPVLDDVWPGSTSCWYQLLDDPLQWKLLS
jgi:hypothetical protein